MKYSIKNYAQALTGIMLQKEFLAKEDVLVKNFLVNKKFDYSEYYHSDGIGTKGIYH